MGSPGRRILRENLPRIRRELGVEAVVVNAENAAAAEPKLKAYMEDAQHFAEV